MKHLLFGCLAAGAAALLAVACRTDVPAPRAEALLTQPGIPPIVTPPPGTRILPTPQDPKIRVIPRGKPAPRLYDDMPNMIPPVPPVDAVPIPRLKPRRPPYGTPGDIVKPKLEYTPLSHRM